MVVLRKKSMLWYPFRAPVYLYRWRLGWLWGNRFLLSRHAGRRTGPPHQTLLEVVEHQKQGPAVVVRNGFGPDCDWVRSIEAKPGEEVVVGSCRIVAFHRVLGEEEAMKVIGDYENRNRFFAPIVRAGFSRLPGWPYRGGENDRSRPVKQLPLIAFRPQG